jgi:polyphosphate kinase 2 (PPK2 family)
MKTSELIEAAQKLSKPYRVTNGKKFHLSDIDPSDTGELTSEDKPRAKEALQTGVQALAELQDVLYAQDRWSVLLIFQAMDAAGKDGAIKHVMSGVNPQGCQVTSFKAPSSEDLDHDYLWRCVKALPERGRIGIFNRTARRFAAPRISPRNSHARRRGPSKCFARAGAACAGPFRGTGTENA